MPSPIGRIDARRVLERMRRPPGEAAPRPPRRPRPPGAGSRRRRSRALRPIDPRLVRRRMKGRRPPPEQPPVPPPPAPPQPPPTMGAGPFGVAQVPERGAYRPISSDAVLRRMRGEPSPPPGGLPPLQSMMYTGLPPAAHRLAERGAEPEEPQPTSGRLWAAPGRETAPTGGTLEQRGYEITPRPEAPPERFGLGESISGLIAHRARKAQQAVDEAGQRDYVPLWEIRNPLDVAHNLGQWGQTGKAVTAAFQYGMVALGTPAEVAERGYGQLQGEGFLPWQVGPEAGIATREAIGLPLSEHQIEERQRMRVEQQHFSRDYITGGKDTNDPAVGQAYQAALSLTFSGPDNMRAAFNDAYELAQLGQLTEENVDRVNARHGVWYKELTGQAILDPLNLFSLPGKVVSQLGRIKKAHQLLVAPLKHGDELMDTARVAKMLKKAATVSGQMRLAETGLGVIAARLNPRFKSGIVLQLAEDSSQALHTMFNIVDRRIVAAMPESIKAGTPEAAQWIARTRGDAFQEVAIQLVRLSDDDPKIVKQAAAALEEAGLGTVPQSLMGRNASLAMKQVMTTEQGKLGYFVQSLMDAKETGRSVEALAEDWYTKMAKTFDGLVDKPLFERGLAVVVPKWIVKKQRPYTRFFGALFMGLSLGYPIRNISANQTMMLASGWSPVGPSANKLLKQFGYGIRAARRGVGASGPDVSKRLPGTAVSEWGEKLSSSRIAYQAHLDTRNRLAAPLWTEVAKSIPEGTDPHLIDLLRRRCQGILHEGPEATRKIEKDLERILKGVEPTTLPVEGVVSPVGPASLLDEPWRVPFDETMDSLKSTGDNAWSEVTRILETSPTPESAIEDLHTLQRRYAQHVKKLSKATKPVGPAIGTVTREAVDQAVRGELPVKTIANLADELSKMEHAIQHSRNMAFTSASDAPNPEAWLEAMERVERAYQSTVMEIRASQARSYAKLATGQVTETAYVEDILTATRKAKATLDREYSRIIGAVGRPIMDVPPLEEVQRRMLRTELVRQAHRAGYPSEVIRGTSPVDVADVTYTAYRGGRSVPDAHFNNKIAQMIGRPGIRNINQLTDDEMLQVINQFRAGRGREATTAEGLYDALKTRVVGAPDRMDFISAIPGATEDLVPVEPQFYELQRLAYHITPTGKVIYESLDDVLDPLWRPTYPVEDITGFNAISFRRVGTEIKATRGGSHLPGDKILHGQLDPQTGAMVLNVVSDNVRATAEYAEDLIRQGIDPNTPVHISGGLLEDYPSAVDKLADLTRSEFTSPAWYLDEEGHRVFIHGTDFIGEVSREKYLAEIDAQLVRLVDGSTDVEGRLAVTAARKVAHGEIPPLGPGPSPLDATYEGAKQAVYALDGLIDEVRATSKVPARPAAATKALSTLDDWQPFLRSLKGRYTEAHVMASDVAKRARDFALLDYADRRFFDPMIQVIFPWAYWHTRTMPNFARALTKNPAMIANYMKLKRELREYNDQDPNVPEWAKEHIVMQVPGVPGSIFWNYQASFNPVGDIFDTWDDPDQQRDALGKMIQRLSIAGPAVHPMIAAIYAAERGLLEGDDAALRSYGYLAGITRGFASITGKTLEPWLWLKDQDGKRVPWTGGSKWDIAKATRRLAWEAGEGNYRLEEAVLGAATRSGPAFEDQMQEILKYRRVSALGSLLFGVRLQRRETWEDEISHLSFERAQMLEAGDEEGAQQIIDDNPWLGASWMAYDNDVERMTSLAWNVLDRFPPGGKQRELLAEAGISPLMLDAFYEDARSPDKDLGDWDRADYNQFAVGIIGLAEILGIPNAEDAQERRLARAHRDELAERLSKKYPNAQQKQETYWRMLDMGDEEGADAYADEVGLYDYWDDLNKEMVKDDLLVKYYMKPEKLDQMAVALMHEQAELNWPGIHATEEEYYAIPEDDYEARRDFRLAHPELREYNNWKVKAQNSIQYKLGALRDLAGTGPVSPELLETKIGSDGPSMLQQGVLEAIDEFNFQHEFGRPPEPPPATASISPEVAATWAAQDDFYAQFYSTHPDFRALQIEYDQIEYVYGKDQAKLWAKQSGYQAQLDEMQIAKVHNPVLLREMSDKQIKWSAKVLRSQQAEQTWPGIFDIQAGYYAIPEKDRKARKAYLKVYPSLRDYWDWKDGALVYYEQTLFAERAKFRK